MSADTAIFVMFGCLHNSSGKDLLQHRKRSGFSSISNLILAAKHFSTHRGEDDLLTFCPSDCSLCEKELSVSVLRHINITAFISCGLIDYFHPESHFYFFLFVSAVQCEDYPIYYGNFPDACMENNLQCVSRVSVPWELNARPWLCC